MDRFLKKLFEKGKKLKFDCKILNFGLISKIWELAIIKLFYITHHMPRLSVSLIWGAQCSLKD